MSFSRMPAASSDSKSNGSAGVIHRLARTLSNKNNISTSPSVPPSVPSSDPVEALAEPTTHEAGTPPASQVPKHKLTAIDRIKDFGKFSKGKKLEFPPSSWFNQGRDPASIPLPETPAPVDGEGKDLDAVVEQTKKIPEPESDPEDPPEPTFLARKIQALIDLLPPIPASSSSRGTHTPPTPEPPAHDADGRPIPPPGSAQIHDARLIALLSSAAVMNGSISRGRQSVWSILERLHPPKHKKLIEAHGVAEDQGSQVESGTPGGANKDDEDDDSSVMMYGPLLPTENSKVEIAESEMVPDVPLSGAQRVEAWKKAALGLAGIWPWAGQKSKGKENEGEKDKTTEIPEASGSETPASSGKGQKQGKETGKRKEHRVWVPSTTKLSLQAMWWGYRIYLPPPVLEILGSKQLEAAKRAALITTSLKWILGNLPVKMLPPTVRPAMFVLQRLIPYLGYIGGFIAWSWSTIKSYDKGYGVYLTATWLLPVALIPGTLEANDFPLNEQPSPAPAPAPNPTPGDESRPPPSQDGKDAPSDHPPTPSAPPDAGPSPMPTPSDSVPTKEAETKADIKGKGKAKAY